MDQGELQKLREDLEKEAKILEEQLQKIAVKNPSVKGDYQAVFNKRDSSDTEDEKAQGVTEYEENRAVEQTLELRLKEIKETLDRIDAGAYGVCSHCAKSIENQRLKASATATLCFDCAKKISLL